jgi:hypothetical protein
MLSIRKTGLQVREQLFRQQSMRDTHRGMAPTASPVPAASTTTTSTGAQQSGNSTVSDHSNTHHMQAHERS